MKLVRQRSMWMLIIPSLVALAACGGAAESSHEGYDDAAHSDATHQADPAHHGEAHSAGAKLNLNTTAEEDFLALPDVGDRMAHEFVEYRPYVSIQQFRREMAKYVDEEQIAAYENHVFVPVNPDECDAETLKQLPGVDEAKAAELIAGRPYGSNAAFLEKLAAHVEGEDLSEAEAYLQVR